MTQWRATDEEARAEARQRLDALAKPLGALGRLEDLAVWLAGVQGTGRPDAAGDGVGRGVRGRPRGHQRHRAVSAYPRDGDGDDGAGVPARRRGGQRARPGARRPGPGRRPRGRRRPGRHPARGASAQGAPRLRGDRPRGRADGRARPTPASPRARRSPTRRSTPAPTCSSPATWGSATPRSRPRWSGPLLGLDADDVVGRGTGVDDETWRHKRDVVAAALEPRPPARRRPGGAAPDRRQRRPGRRRPASCVRAAERGVAGAAGRRGLGRLRPARRAARLPAPSAWWCAGHRSTEPAHRLRSRRSGCSRSSTWSMRLGEASGALTALPVLRTARAAARRDDHPRRVVGTEPDGRCERPGRRRCGSRSAP